MDRWRRGQFILGKRPHPGHANGLDLSIDCVTQPAWEPNTCLAIAEMLKPAGINLKVNILPGGTYWDRWLTTPFGFTSWTHRHCRTPSMRSFCGMTVFPL